MPRNLLRRRSRVWACESLEHRRVLASISGQIVNDMDGDGAITLGEDGMQGVQVFVDANGNGTLDTVGTYIEPDLYADGQTLNVKFTDVLLTVADKTNAPLDSTSDSLWVGPRVSAHQDTLTATGSYVFGYTEDGIDNVNFFHDERRLRMDFLKPVSTVDLDFVGSRPFADDIGAMEAYNAQGVLIDSYETSGLAQGEFETMSVSRTEGDIAFVVAHTKKPSVTGRLDNLRINASGSEVWTVTDSNGEYTLDNLGAGTYSIGQVTPVNYTRSFPTNPATRSVTLDSQDATGSANFGNVTNIISGIAFNDVGTLGTYEPGTDTAAAGRTVYLDVNQNGALDFGAASIEPDDYAEGSSVAHAISGVTLSAANFRNTPTSDVTAVTETLSSTGTKAFGNDQGTAWTNTHRLRMDFDSPVSFVSVDVIGSRSSSESAIIIGYDSEGRQLVGAQSEGLFEGDTDTISISRAEADISYAIAYTVSIAVDGTARFDNLQFDGLLQEPTATSGSTGAYSFGPLANGAYDVRVDTNAGESTTTPAAGFVSVTLDAPSEQANLNLGISSESVGTWHNAASPMDVNNDGFIVPFDAILIINELNGPQYSDSVTGQLDTPPNPVPAFFDVNNDGFVAPIDVIMIINHLNANPAAGVAAVADLGEGESISNSTSSETVVDSHVASAVLSQDVKRNVAASMDVAFADIDTDPQPGKRPFWLSE